MLEMCSLKFNLKSIVTSKHFITCEKLLCKSKIPSLKIRRLRTVALEVFKIINKECPVYLQDSI
jgi:hypothetical protein